MGKSVSDAVLDAALDAIGASNQLTICETEPTTWEEANSDKGTGAGKVLARVSLTGGDFTKQAGDVSGRKTVIAAKAGLSIDQTGTADHVALTTTGALTLNYVTTAAAAKPVTSGETLDVGSWKAEIEAPQ